MILMMSGRTDIIAYYYPWLKKRIEEGYVDTRNPFNPKQVYRYKFEDVDALMLCTKNPLPLLEEITPILKFPTILHVTLTPYGKDLEPNVPNKMKIIDAVKQLSSILGKDNIVIRYDPIVINEKYTISQHGKSFDHLVSLLHPYVNRFIISFVDEYKNTKAHHIQKVNEWQMQKIGKVFSETIKKYQVSVQTCAEVVDLSEYGIQKGECLSKKDLETLLGRLEDWEIDDYKREACRCILTKDIGAYNSCLHLCKYCYANYDEKQIQENYALHDINSSLLIGTLHGDEEIRVAKNKNRQVTLF